MPRPSRPRPVAGLRARARVQTARPAPTVRDDAGTRPAATAHGHVAVIEHPHPRSHPDGAGSDTEQARTPTPARAGAVLSGRGRVLLGALLVLTFLALAAFAAVASRVHADSQVETARDQAQSAATDHVVDILSYDYRHLDKDFHRGRGALTGTFKGDYAQTTSRVIRPTATRYKAVVKAEVAASSVVSATADRVVVLLFVNQTTTSTRLDGPKVDLNRVRLTLDNSDGRWLVSDVRAL